MENKQTAVEWLEENLIGNPHFESDFIHNRNTFEQAKAIEKEQSIKDYYAGVKDEMQNVGNDFEDYYQKTYGNK